jgi:hypothetical protein
MTALGNVLEINKQQVVHELITLYEYRIFRSTYIVLEIGNTPCVDHF